MNYNEFADDDFGVEISKKELIITGVLMITVGSLLAHDVVKYAKKIRLSDENTTSTELVDVINDNVQVGEVKVFEPGEHYISVRISELNISENGDITYSVNNIPEGYRVYQIIPYENDLDTDSSNGYDVWFVNDKTVEVTATYSENLGNNGYYQFGSIVEQNVRTR